MSIRHRHFSMEEANALIPTLERHMHSILQMHVLLRTYADTLADGGIPISPELLSAEETISCAHGLETTLSRTQALYSAIRAELEAVHALGVEVKDIEQGLVDFYSYRDGLEEVLLCWQLGERSIQHYHDTTKGYPGRQSTVGHVFLNSRAPTALQAPPLGPGSN